MAGFSIHHTTIFFILLTYVSGQDCKIEVPLGTPNRTVPLFCHVRVYCTYNGNNIDKIWYIRDHLWNVSSNRYLEPKISNNDTMSSLTIIAKCYCDNHGCVYKIVISCKYFLNDLVTESTALNLEANKSINASCVSMTSTVTEASDISTSVIDIVTTPSSTHHIETLSGVSSRLTSSYDFSPSSHNISATPNSSHITTTTAAIQIETILKIVVPFVAIGTIGISVFIAALLVCYLCRKKLFPESCDCLSSIDISTPSDEISNEHDSGAAGTRQEEIALQRQQSSEFRQDQSVDPSNFYTDPSSPR